MADNFGYCWRTVRLYCPAAPTFLAREWVNAAWKQLLAARRWGFMRRELTVTTVASSTGILNEITRAIDPARLGVMRLGTGPLGYDGLPFTHLERTQMVLPARLGVMRLGASRLGYSGLESRYLVLPPDFASFVVVVDRTRQVRLPFRYSLADLVAANPALNAGGPPLALVATTPDPATGLPRYWLYPSGTATTLTAIYNRQAPRLTDTDVFQGVLADGAEVLVAGALAQAALWPGTGDKPNSYFNAGLAQAKAQEFATGIQMLSLRDDEQYPDDLWDYFDEADCGCLGHGADPRTTDVSYSSYY